MKALLRAGTLLFLFCLTTAAFAGGAQAASEQEIVEIDLLFKPQHMTEEDVEALMAKHPHIRVAMQEHSYDKLMALLAAGTPPDLSYAASYRVPSLVNAGVLRSIEDLVEKSSLIDPGDFYPIMDAFRYDRTTRTQGKGDLYGLNRDWNITDTYFYRKDLFADAGLGEPDPRKEVLWRDFRKSMEKLVVREAGVTKRWALGGVIDSNPEITVRNWLSTAGTDLYNEDMTRAVLTTNDEVKKAMAFQYGMMRDHLIPSEVDPAPSWAMPLFTNTQESPMAVFIWGYWGLATISDTPELEGKVGYVVGPVWEKSDFKLLPSVTGWVMPDNGDDKQAAAAFLVLEDQVAGDMAVARIKSGWGYTPLKSLTRYLPTETPLQKQAMEITEYQMKNLKMVPERSSIYSPNPYRYATRKFLGQYLKDEITFDEFVARTEAEMNSMIADGMKAQ